MASYTATADDRTQAENIRKQYQDRKKNKMEQLQRLDGKVKAPGKVLGTIVGVLGALIMGGGMSLVMIWSNMTLGLGLGIGGMLLAAVAYPIYTVITSRRKKKYADEIFRLSDELMEAAQ